MKMTEPEIRAAFLDILRIPSVTGSDGEEQACAYLERILDWYSIEHRRICRDERRPNLVARIRAERPVRPPMILISHIDVVDGDETKWLHPVFSADVADGRIWARGSLDTKHLTMMELYAFVHLKGHEAEMDRDALFIATVDEEKGSAYGMGYVREAEPELFSAGTVINEGGGFPLCINGRNYLMLTVGEKAVCKVRITARGTGGHASAPGKDQALQKMAEALERIFSRESELNFGSRQTRDAMRQIVGSEDWDDPAGADIFGYAGQNSIGMRDYRLGTRSNVIAPAAEAVLEFKVLPRTDPREITAFLDRVLDGCQVSWAVESYEDGFENDFTRESMIDDLISSCERNGFSGTVLPMLALGRTDGRFFAGTECSVYGCSPTLMGDSFSAVLPKVHGNNESILEESFLFGCRVLDEVICKNCGCPQAAGPAADL